MKQAFKKQNSPRMQSAINRTFHSWTGDWWIRSDVRELGMLALDFAYGADKYDVLNKLSTGHRNKIVTFARGDIRHRLNRNEQICDGIIALVMFHLIVSLLITLCY